MRNFAFTLLTYTFSLLSIGLHAQCPEGNVTLRNQADVDTYATIYPNCTKIQGQLKIGGYFAGGNSDITDVSPLQSVTTITGNLLIVFNEALTNINGLNQIALVGGNVHVFDNMMLTNLQGLGGLVEIEGNFKVEGNPGLKNLQGLEELVSVGGDMSIARNTALTTLKSLDKLTSVDGFFVVLENPVLTNIGEIKQLRLIGGNLSITDNKDLVDLQGLQGLETVGGDFNILQNTALNDLGDLKPTMSPSGNMRIYNNFSLSDCSAKAICQHISGGGTVEIGNNGTGCSTITDLENSCSMTLPVELSDFQVKATKKNIVLTWQTMTEKNSNVFEIQRSKDAANWTTIGLQRSKGDATTRQNYTFTDNNPIIGKSYYRLIQKDLDARIKPSDILGVAFYTDIVTVHPNPVNDVLQITVMDDQTVDEVMVYDTTGRIAIQGTPNTNVLNVSNLSTGTYMVAIIMGENTIYKKIIVK